MNMADLGKGVMVFLLVMATIGSCGAISDYQLFQRGFDLIADDISVELTMHRENLSIHSIGDFVAVKVIDDSLFKILYAVIDEKGDRHLRQGEAIALFFSTGGENITSQLTEPMYFGRYPGLDLVASRDLSGDLVSEVLFTRAGVRMQAAGNYVMFYDARADKLWDFGFMNPDGTLTEITADSFLGVSSLFDATYSYEKVVKKSNCEC